MGWIDQVSDLLKRYRTASASAPPQSTQEDFAKVAQGAPRASLSGGLADAFRSESTPEFADMITSLYTKSDSGQRAGILTHLLEAAGPAALSGGALSSLSRLLTDGKAAVTPEQAQNVSPETVRQLAGEAEKHEPSIIDKASDFYAQHPDLIKTLGASALALVMSHLSKRH